MNVIPKQGGNAFRGTVSFAGNTEGMQGDNLSPEGMGLGLPRVPAPEDVWEIDGAVGGPIARDRAWYFVSGRRQQLKRLVPGLFANANAGNPAAWLYAYDLTSQAYSDRTWENVSARVTVLATTRNRFSVFVDEQTICRSCTGATSATGFPDPSVSPEAQGVGDYQPQRVLQASWTSPAADRLLLDARFSRSAYGWGNSERDGNDRSLIRVVGNPQFSTATLAYRSQDWFDNDTSLDTWQASMSLWAGAHSFKIGYQGLFALDDRTFQSNDQSVTYRLVNGIPNQITQMISPFTVRARLAQTSAYVQDQWTGGRVTVQGAVRFDRVRSWFPEQQFSGRFLPSPVVIPETRGVDAYTDVTPRLGIAYDVTGTGRTAVKIGAGRYLDGAGTTGVYYDSNPATRLSRSANRGWFDSNLNYVPNCGLENPLVNGECGQLANPIPLGQPIPGAIDSGLLRGSNVRLSDWNVGASVEHQILPRASLEVGYVRRWFDGFTVVDNLLVNDGDFQPVTVTAPQNSNLPNGGGQTIGPLYIQNPASFSRFNQVTMPTDRYGTQSRRSDSVDVIVNGRTSFGLTVQGGSSTTRTVSDSCEIRASVRESAPLNPYCDVSTGALTQFRGLAAYTIPNVDVQIGAVYQNKPGPPIIANGTIFAGFVNGQLTNVTVNLIEPGTLYGERISQLDVRVTKVLRVGRTRIAAGIDLYNALNSSDALTYNTSFFAGLANGSVGLPTSVMTPRLLRFTADVSF